MDAISTQNDLTSTETGSMLEMGTRQVRAAADHLGLGQADLARFLAPARVIEVTVPDPRPDGDVITAIRVQHSRALGPAKGGVRMADTVNRSEVEALALFMTLKTATATLPLGGGKAGIVADAGSFDQEQRLAVVADLARAWAPVIGPDSDVLGPDVGTGPEEMAAFDRAWQEATGESGSPSTGKPTEDGGLELRTGATAAGLEIVYTEFAERLELSDSLRFAVHGYGSVGRGMAQRLVDRGHILVAASDSGGTVHDPDGLDPAELDRRKQDRGSVSDGVMGSSEVLTVDCDLLIPAALQGVVTESVAAEVKASMVLEGANGPCTWAGAQLLLDRGVTVIPDILANAGGVSASFEEMTEPDERDQPDVIEKRFRDRLQSATADVWEAAAARSLDLRTAATVLAMERVLDADG